MQVTKTISLARDAPLALMELRRTGRIQFTTLMDWFDRDDPGHYLALIKGVKVSILALVPPVDGVHGRLTANGISYIEMPATMDDDGRLAGFERKPAVRTVPDSIALDGTVDESGLFVFDYSDPMLLPFEGMGVEAAWTLELPRATNRFELSSIVDVLISIDCTARQSDELELEVKSRLGDALFADVLLDARVLDPDEWDHLLNPRTGHDEDLILSVPAPRHLFPPNAQANFGGGATATFQTRHLSVVVTGTLDDSEAALFGAAATLTRDGLTLPLSALHRQSVVAHGERSVVVFTTRAADPATGAVPSQAPGGGSGHGLDPLGSWDLDLRTVPAAVRTKLTGMVLVPTVEGRTTWA